MPTVSVIVPVFRPDEFLDQCLDSIKAQTWKDIELIVVEDKDGAGAAATRNRGLDRATGYYIAFCDSDDYLAPDAIERMVNAIGDTDMVVGSFRKFGDFESVVISPTGQMGRCDIAEYVMGNLRNPRENQILSGCWAKLFRRPLVGRFPPLATAEDMAFNFDYLTRCFQVKFISDIVYHNRKREGSLTTTYDEKNRMGLFGFLQGLKYVKRFLHGFYPDDEIEDALDNSKVYHSMLYFSRICAQEGGDLRSTLRMLYP